MQSVQVVKIDVATRKVRKIKDYVAEEKPLHIFLNKTRYATIFCSPQNLAELAVGHLLSEGIIKSAEEIEKINLNANICHINLKPNVDLEKRLKLSKHFSRIILSACGGPYQPSKRLPKVKSHLRVKAEVIQKCVINLNFIAETFRKTGGVHAAAIYKGDGCLIAFAEDVGRHNAVDKVIGSGALRKMDFSGCFLALSGRLTGDIVFKAAKAGLPIVASLSAAVDSGINIAKDVNLTLVGFVRGTRMNVYNCEERIAV
jgi:FdhD protein